jgi:hypothetical protein
VYNLDNYNLPVRITLAIKQANGQTTVNYVIAMETSTSKVCIASFAASNDTTVA